MWGEFEDEMDDVMYNDCGLFRDDYLGYGTGVIDSATALADGAPGERRGIFDANEPGPDCQHQSRYEVGASLW